MDSAIGGQKFFILRLVVLSLCINLVTLPLALALWSFLREVSRAQAAMDITHRLSQSPQVATGSLLQR